MPRFRAVSTFLLILFTVVSAACREDGDIQITGLRFEGVHQVDTGALADALQTRKGSRLPWGRKRFFDRRAFEADLQRIEAFYRDRGFPDAKVTAVDPVLNDRQDKIDITRGKIAMSVAKEERYPSVAALLEDARRAVSREQGSVPAASAPAQRGVQSVVAVGDPCPLGRPAPPRQDGVEALARRGQTVLGRCEPAQGAGGVEGPSAEQRFQSAPEPLRPAGHLGPRHRVHHPQQRIRRRRRHLLRTITQPRQQRLTDVRHLLQPIEGQKPRRALDRVNRTENA